MDKKPYTAPELVVLGDVVDITKATDNEPADLDANYPNFELFPNWVTDNIVG